MVESRKRLWWCFAAGGGLLGLATTAERLVHHTPAYGHASAALLHACIAVLAAGGLGALIGAALDALDVVVGGDAKRRTRAVVLACGGFGAAAYWSVIRVSKYGQVLPLAVGLAVFAAIAAGAGYAAARLAPHALAHRRTVGVLAALAVSVLAWIDLHAYARSYGNVHLLLAAIALLGAGSSVALLVQRPERLVRALAIGAALATAGALLLPVSASAKNAVLQLGALEKLLIQHALWPALDRDGDGAASMPLGTDCDDGDPSNAPLRLPVRAPSLGCAPIAAAAAPVRRPPAPLTPERDLILVIVDTWRIDTPSQLPAWTRPFANYTGYRSCGSRTEQVVSQLLGAEGCPKAFPRSSLADFLAAAGYELAYMGEYAAATTSFPTSKTAESRAALLELARAFFSDREGGKPLFAVVHFKGGHAGYDGEGDSMRERYDDAIARTLSAVGELVPLLPHDAVVVVAGDHGEEFGEHEGSSHALSLYEEVLRTPVLVRAAGLAAGTDPRPMECAGLAELAAALVSGAPVPPPSAPESFAVLASPKGVHGGLSETVSFATKRPDGMKLIWQPRLDLFELYDLNRDPYERHNLADAQPELLRTLASELFARVRDCAGDKLIAR